MVLAFAVLDYFTSNKLLIIAVVAWQVSRAVARRVRARLDRAMMPKELVRVMRLTRAPVPR